MPKFKLTETAVYEVIADSAEEAERQFLAGIQILPKYRKTVVCAAIPERDVEEA